MINITDNLLDINTAEELVYSKSVIITSKQMAVLIIKPSNHTPNANNSAQNIENMVKRLEDKKWSVHALKVIKGNPDNISKIASHYPQPFHDSNLDDVRNHITDSERAKISDIWGNKALHYSIYHPVKLLDKGVMDYYTSAKTWHKGRGVDNNLLNVGDISGINNITNLKSEYYGKRRLYLVRPESDDPFFIVNGFAAELANKFSRPEERIVVMVITQNDPRYDIEYLREYVIGATNPREAHAGTIRNDALYSESYKGSWPISSKDEVGIENNIVHLSDSLAEAKRELGIWTPELFWYPPCGKFAPDISYERWNDLRQNYIASKLSSNTATLYKPSEKSLIKLSGIKNDKMSIKVSVNMLAGGSGGRLFGYETPEDQRNKFSAPLVNLNDKYYSFLELQLLRLSKYKNDIEFVNIFGSLNSQNAIQGEIDRLKNAGFLNNILEKCTHHVRKDVPRIYPNNNDLIQDEKFKNKFSDDVKGKKDYLEYNGNKIGEVVQENGAVSSKPPGHLSVLLHYVYHCLKKDLNAGVDVSYFHIGEDSAAIPNLALLSHVKSSSAVASISFIESNSLDHGFLAFTDKGAKVCEHSDVTSDIKPPYYLHTARIAFNVKNLAVFLAGSVENFLELSEKEIRDKVDSNMLSMISPRFEVKPINNYNNWVGQFAYTIGQIVEAMPVDLINDDVSLQKITTFKSQDELKEMMPSITEEFSCYT